MFQPVNPNAIETDVMKELIVPLNSEIRLHKNKDKKKRFFFVCEEIGTRNPAYEDIQI